MATPKFKVGDRVKVNHPQLGVARDGEVFVVTEVHESKSVHLTDDWDAGQFWLRGDRLDQGIWENYAEIAS